MALWDRAAKLVRIWSDRNAWLAANDTAPEYAERCQRAEQTARKFIEAVDALAEWAGVGVVEVCDALGEVVRCDC